MRFTSDDEPLELSCELEPWERGADLTKDGLGDAILDLAVRGMKGATARQRSPSGEPWAELARSTRRQRARSGYSDLQVKGVRTGSMFSAENLDGERQIEPTQARWTYAGQGLDWKKAHSYHNGNPINNQPARPFVGWTYEARTEAKALVAEAIGRAAAGP